MPPLTTTKARDEFADTVNRAAYGKERVILHRRGKAIAAVVPIEDLRLLEQLEDEIDVAAAKRVRDDPTEEAIPWGDVKAELGL
jgi:prevent-host-death family protein